MSAVSGRKTPATEPRDDVVSIRSSSSTSSRDSFRERVIRRPPPNPNDIVTEAPEFRLGYLDTVCLIVNRMVGSGIFMTPTKIMAGTNSTGVALLFWFAGTIYALAGTHVYIEYGLNVPRFVVDRLEQSVPRSGGDLNYLQYVFRWLGYRGGIVLPITCLFGAAFLAFGNMAGNSINFAIWISRAAGVEPTDNAVRGIACAVAILSCCIHAFSRRGGISLNNLLAIIKALILVLIIITGIVAWAGGFPNTAVVIGQNTTPRYAFQGASGDAHGYADAFLAIIFAFSGFEQSNYVLGEIGRPRRRFPISLIVGLSTVSVLYMLVNIAYMVVVPKEDQTTHVVAQRFFELTYGQLHSDSTVGYRVFCAFVAISSLGNIIVMTFTAARVKQEIAKQGVLPGARFFASNYDLSIGRLLAWFKRRSLFQSFLNRPWLAPELHSEQTPVGALVLHTISCLLLIGATSGMSPSDAYSLLTSLGAYLLNGVFGFLLGLGLLLLRFSRPPQTAGAEPRNWSEMTGRHIKPSLSIAAAVVYMVGNAYPVVVTWIPPSAAFVSTLSWYLVPVISWVTLAVGALWYLGFLWYARRRERRDGLLYSVERKPEFESDNGGDSEASHGQGRRNLIMAHETVILAWVAKELVEKEAEERSLSQHQPESWMTRPGYPRG